MLPHGILTQWALVPCVSCRTHFGHTPTLCCNPLPSSHVCSPFAHASAVHPFALVLVPKALCVLSGQRCACQVGCLSTPCPCACMLARLCANATVAVVACMLSSHRCQACSHVAKYARLPAGRTPCSIRKSRRSPSERSLLFTSPSSRSRWTSGAPIPVRSSACDGCLTCFPTKTAC